MSETVFTPEMNNGINVFVFGSNLEGVHGKGAAKEVLDHWGARWGVGNGMCGNSYALPTKWTWRKSMTISEVAESVRAFLGYAAGSERTFLVTKIGCGYAGFTEDEIRPVFQNAPPNCVLPEGWR